MSTLSLTLANGQELDTNNATVAAEFTSSMLLRELPGSFTLPFALPATPTNQIALGFPENPHVRTSLQSSVPVTVADAGLALSRGRLNIREANELFYDADISFPLANIPPAFWDTRLCDLENWGGEQLPTITRSVNLWQTSIPEADVNFFGLQNSNASPVYYELLVDGNIIFVHENAVAVSSPTAKLKERLEELTGVYNSQNYPAYLAVDDTSRTITFSPSGNNFAVTLRATVGLGFQQKVTEYTFQKIPAYAEADPTHFVALAANNFASVPWRMAAMKVSGGDDIKVSNVFFNGGLDIEALGLAAARQIVSPVPTLKMMLEGLAKEIGFTLSGDFHSDADLQEMCFYSGYVLDKQLETVQSPYFILDFDFQYKKMMPVWTVRKFLTELKKTFNLSITFNSFTRIWHINKNDVLVAKPATKDITHLVSPKMRVRSSPQAVNNFLLKWLPDSSDSLAPTVLKTDDAQEPTSGYPYPIVSDTNGYTVLESELLPCYLETRTEYPNFLADFNPFAIFQPSVDPFKAITYQALICGKPLYNDPAKIEATPPRIFFYNENFDGSLKRNFYNLVWDDFFAQTEIRLATGLYTSFWQNTLKKLADLVEIETNISLDAPDIAALDFTEKLIIEGNNYLIKQINVDFPIRKQSRVILWRC